MKKLRELSKKELKDYSDFLTVGRLKKFLNEHDLPDDALVVAQRVEDTNYENNNWGVYLKEGEDTPSIKQWNKNVENGKYLDKKQYPKIKKEDLVLHTDKEIKESMDQYTPVWCCVRYPDDKDILFLDLHY
jgi:hypothetical protein